MSTIITTPTHVAFHAVQRDGYRLRGQVKKFYFWKKVIKLVHTQDDLERMVVNHFQGNRRTCYILIRVSNQVFCYKRNMSCAEITSCSIQQSKFGR